MLIGIPKEIKDQEYRVAMTPGGIKSLTEAGHRVLVQEGAGKGSGLADSEYTAAGASVISDLQAIWEADMIVKVKEPQPDEFELMQPDRILFTFLHLAAEESLTMEMLKRHVTGIGYETVELESGELPLLKPMSEIAGRLAVQVGAHYLEKKNGGKGKLISGVPGVEPARVVIIGSGTVGSNAARIAVGMGAEVILISTFIDQLRRQEDIIQGRFLTLSADPFQIAGAVAQADLLIGAVLVPGARTPKVVSREMVASMKAGSVIVDVAVDQGGCIETTRPTTHSDPVYDVNGIIHYAVTNIPGAVPATSTQALANATLPYIRKLADGGLDFLKKDRALLKGVNTYQGHLTYRAVADALGIQYTPFVS